MFLTKYSNEYISCITFCCHRNSTTSLWCHISMKLFRITNIVLSHGQRVELWWLKNRTINRLGEWYWHIGCNSSWRLSFPPLLKCKSSVLLLAGATGSPTHVNRRNDLRLDTCSVILSSPREQCAFSCDTITLDNNYLSRFILNVHKFKLELNIHMLHTTYNQNNVVPTLPFLSWTTTIVLLESTQIFNDLSF